MRPAWDYFGESHDILRKTVARFVEREIKPFVDEWEEAGEFPKELFRKAAGIGLLGVCYPEEWSGFQSDIFHEVVVTEELTRSGSGGLAAGLMSHSIALPPILALGSQEQKERFIPPVLRGEKIAALGITETRGRFRRCQHPDARCSRRPSLCGQWIEDHDNVGLQGGFCHYGREDRRSWP